MIFSSLTRVGGMVRRLWAPLLAASLLALAPAAVGQITAGDIGCKKGQVLRNGVCVRPAAVAKQEAAERRAAEKKATAERKAAEKKATAERKAAEKKATAERRAAEKKATAERKAAAKKAGAAKKKSNLPVILGSVGGGVAALLLLNDDDDPVPAAPTCSASQVLVNGQCVARVDPQSCTGFDVVMPGANACSPCPASSVPNGERNGCVVPVACVGNQVRDAGTRLCRAPPAPNPTDVAANGGCGSEAILMGRRCTQPNAGLAPAGVSRTAWQANLAFNSQDALEVVGAHYAYGNNVARPVFNGAGVQLAIVGDGVSQVPAFADPAVAGQATTYSRLSRVDQLTFEGDTPFMDDNGNVLPVMGASQPVGRQTWPGFVSRRLFHEHGTSAASIMAGRVHVGSDAASSQMGIAPGARVLDVPFGEFRVAYCAHGRVASGTGTPCPTRGFVEDGVSSIMNVWGLMGAAVKVAVDHASAPKYVLLPPRQDHLPGTALSSYSAGSAEVIKQRVLPLVNAITSSSRTAVTRPVFLTGTGDIRVNYSILRCATDEMPGSNTSTCVAADVRRPGLLAQLPRLADSSAILGSDAQDIEDWYLAVVPTQGGAARSAKTSDGAGCGEAATWCLAAPGWGLRSATRGARISDDDRTSQYYQVGAEAHAGSEFAAALVAGALALVDQAFTTAHGSSVSPREVRQRLLDTASQEGIYEQVNGPMPASSGVDPDDNRNGAIYGQGHLDIVAALTPQSAMTVLAPPRLPGRAGGSAASGHAHAGASSHIKDPGLSLAGLGLALPPSALAALGDAKLMALDAHGFPFYVPVADLAREAQGLGGFVPVAAPSAVRGGFGFSAGEGSGWAMALAPRHMRVAAGTALGAAVASGRMMAGSGSVSLAADAHLGLSPLMTSSLDGGGLRHLALQAQFGATTLGVMACEQRRDGASPLAGLQAGDKSGCMALSWDWNPGRDFGLTLRTHRLDTRRGLYGYGPRCGVEGCADGPATATELGLGGFARVADGLRLSWNYWQGMADDGAGAGYLSYAGLRHSGASLALGDAAGAWSLYIQQPLQTSGRLRLQLPSHRTPDGRVHFRAYDLAVRGGARHLRLGFAGRLALTRKGGFLHLNLGGEAGADGLPGAAPYAQLEARLPW